MESASASRNWASGARIQGAVEIVEDVRGTWHRENDYKDFIGHVKVKHSGVYNFKVKFHNNKVIEKPGSIFLYENSWGTLKYIGAYEIKEHRNDYRDGMVRATIRGSSNDSSVRYIEDYWKYWVDIVINAGKDYYIEVDCPNIEMFEYKLTGNREQTGLNQNWSSGIWIFNKKLKLRYLSTYLCMKDENKSTGNPIVVMYLDINYKLELENLIDYLITLSEKNCH